MSDSTKLYRHFDTDGNLLYVGISINAMTRLAQHSSDSSWTDEISRVEIEMFDTRLDALEAERSAIKSESPIYNVRHAVAAHEDTRTEHLHLCCEPALKRTLDALRRAEEDLPSQSEMIHRLVQRAYRAHEIKRSETE